MWKGMLSKVGGVEKDVVEGFSALWALWEVDEAQTVHCRVLTVVDSIDLSYNRLCEK